MGYEHLLTISRNKFCALCGNPLYIQNLKGRKFPEILSSNNSLKYDFHAMGCDFCGEYFEMEKWCKDSDVATLHGIFDQCCPGWGNGFSATICSFQCAHELFENEKWKDMKKYKRFVKLKAKLVRVECYLTCLKKTSEEIVEEWLKIECKPGEKMVRLKSLE